MRDAVEKNPDIATRIAQYELAYRMQMSVPELVDIADEPQHVLEMYGCEGADGSFAYNCLLARRLAERGVRFIHLYHRDWDFHDGIRKYIPELCKSADQPSAAADHRSQAARHARRHAGDLGRRIRPHADGPGRRESKPKAGRDHHIRGFSMWMAGGGIKPGTSYGATDELGYYAVDNPVHVHDLHATMLHLLGIDHERLTYRYQGRDFRLTDVAGKVVNGILA